MKKIFKMKKGFTLVELSVVLVILSVLSALIIPSFAQWITNAQVETCQLNRAQLARYYVYEKTDHYGDSEPVTMQKVLDGAYETSAPDVAQIKCPSGGTYSVNATTGALECSIAAHNNSSGVTSTNPLDCGMLNTMIEISERLHKSSIDSLAPGTGATAEFFAATQGVNFDAMDMKSWSYINNGTKKILMWTAADISTLAPGTTVPVLRYNSSGQTYTVWYARVAENTAVIEEGGSSYTYKVLREATEYPASKNVPASQKTDYAQAKAWYNEAMAAAGY